MKKILFVITKSNWGGAQKYVYDLATSMPKSEFEIAVAVGGTGEAGASTGLLETRLRETSIRTIFIKSFVRDISLVREFKAFLELLRILKNEKPDVLHLNSSKAGGLGVIAGRILGIRKIIFTAHGFAYNEIRPLYERILIWIASWLTVICAHTVIILSEYELKHAPVMFSRKKLVVIHNGIDVNAKFGSGDKIRKAFPPNVRIIGTVGELTKNKNQIELIEKARVDPEMYVAIVGEGDERTFLTKKICEYGLTDRVKLFGFMPASEVLRGFDVFALPSIKEGLPYVLLEAKVAGLPIIANRVGGVGEILDSKNINEFSLKSMIEKTVALYR